MSFQIPKVTGLYLSPEDMRQRRITPRRLNRMGLRKTVRYALFNFAEKLQVFCGELLEKPDD
jgi:hypothetical protein